MPLDTVEFCFETLDLILEQSVDFRLVLALCGGLGEVQSGRLQPGPKFFVLGRKSLEGVSLSQRCFVLRRRRSHPPATRWQTAHQRAKRDRPEHP